MSSNQHRENRSTEERARGRRFPSLFSPLSSLFSLLSALYLLIFTACGASAQSGGPCGPDLLFDNDLCQPVELVIGQEGGHVFWVDQRHPAASDRNPGTQELPWKTIGRATGPRVLQPGDAVFVRSGVYRESVEPQAGGVPGRFVTYAAYPGDTVIITGADEVTGGWMRDGDAWKLPWTLSLEAYGEEEFRRELMVVDGDVLRPVFSRAAVAPGTFFVEGPSDAPSALVFRLKNDAAPDGHRIEVGVRHPLFYPYTDNPYVDCGDPGQPGYLRVIGFTFRHAVNRAQWGAVCAGSEGSLFENNRVEWTNGVGIDASGLRHTFRNNAASYNGQMGFKADCDDCLFDYNEASFNNWKGHDLYWEAGGGKWARSERTIILHHTAIGNHGPGLWLDIDNHDNVIAHAVLTDNEGAGLILELNTTGTLVCDSFIARTRWHDWSGTGLLVQAASGNYFVANTIVENEGTGLWLRQDPEGRGTDHGQFVYNNLVARNARNPHPGAREVALEAATLDEARTNRFDGNVYHRHPSTMDVSTFFFLPDPASPADFRAADLARWQLLTRGDAQARVLDVTARLSKDDPRGASALGSGVALPEALCARVRPYGGC